MKKIVPIILFYFILLSSCLCQNKPLDVGDHIPMFKLKDQDGRIFNMKDSLGVQTFVIFFYPKDESMVCTKEACAFRDSAGSFVKAGAMVIGINSGTVESHKKF